jgi:malonyl CoA-acyl carrier protein transacylase/NADP-dependent 3-hydroxy acid dehydrogenase YdfG
VDWDLEDVLAGADGAPGLDTADVVQPVLWAVMVSLAATWQAAGVAPDAVIGHSQGEIAAAVVAGILSLEDGARVVALRSRALLALAGRGGMLSVAEPADQVRQRLVPWGDRLAVAAVNGPSATVVSGEPAALAELAAACQAAEVRTRLLPVDYASHSVQVEALRDEILAALATVTPGPAQVRMVSAMTGQWLDGLEAEAGYWFQSLRSPVEFDAAVRVLAGSGYRAFVEISPHPVLTAAISETAADAGPGVPVTVTGTLRRDDGGPGRLLTSLAAVHVRGVRVNWGAVLGGGRRVDLPTYAFEHRRYWPQPSTAGAGDVTAAGLAAVRHPLLGAAVELAGGEGYLFTGRLSVRSQPWLADHAVLGSVVLPGAAFVELAVQAGDASGCGRIADLRLEVLVLPVEGAVQIQVVVGGPDTSRCRSVEIYARPGDAGGGVPWTRYASGLLAPTAPAVLLRPEDFTAWPPPGAVAVETAGAYEVMAAGGYEYGPAFRGLQAVWRRGPEVFAEVALPAEAAAGAGSFGLHPALLDAALHAVVLAETGGDSGAPGIGAREVRLPVAWTGVSLHAAGAAVLRVRLSQQAEGLSLAAADGTGAPVLSVDSLESRPVAAGELEADRGGLQDALFSVAWVPVPSIVDEQVMAGRWAVAGDDHLGLAAGLADAGIEVRAYPSPADLAAAIELGEPIPDVVLACAGVGAGGSDEAAAARLAAGQVLGLIQGWLAQEWLSAARLVVVTAGAVAARPGEGLADLAGAAVWGLVRSAQSENPGRLMLADLPAGDGVVSDLPEVLGVLAAALQAGEPELAVRERTAYARRLARPAGGLMPGDGGPRRLAATGTALITGGTGTLGALVARHLADTGRARGLLLASRSGPAAPGAAVLAADLAARDTDVRVAACDAADPAVVAGLLAWVPADCPLTTVVHAAGVIDDGVIGSLTPDRIDAVMRPKADAAWHLHQLTQDLDLDAFVLFSSAAATFGSAGQGNYAAGNAFLDGLASYRRAAGLPASSLAWGLWADASAMTGHLGEDSRARMATAGVTALSAADGLALLDLATARDEALLVPARLNLAALRAGAQAGALPALFHGLAGGPARRAAAAGQADSAGPALRERLARASEAEQEGVLSDLMRREVAVVLGHDSPEAVDMELGFLEQGFDSLTLLELRNRLNTVTGLELSGSAVFEYPTPTALAWQLRAELCDQVLLADDSRERPDAAAPRYTTSGDAAPAADPGPAPVLGGLYAQAARDGRVGEIMPLIRGLASFRPTYTHPSDLGTVPKPAPMCWGPATPGVICFPSFAGRPQEYARFAEGFRGSREVSSIAAPGFAAGEPLPASGAALIAVHAENIRRSADDTPFVLAGHSSGGLIAHALAAHLESVGMAPAGVVLLDTYAPERTGITEKFWSLLPGVMADDDEQRDDDAWVTAMAHYFSLDWTDLAPTSLPTLLVRAEEPLDESPERDDARPAWALPGNLTIVDVPGDHFTMMARHAETTTQAVNDWLAGLPRLARDHGAWER